MLTTLRDHHNGQTTAVPLTGGGIRRDARHLGRSGRDRELIELAVLLLPDEPACVIVAELDPATGPVEPANAGHLPVLRLYRDGGRWVTPPQLVTPPDADDERRPALGFNPPRGTGTPTPGWPATTASC